MKKILSIIALAAFALTIAVTASAGSDKLMLQAKKFDPGHTNQVIQASWDDGAGVGGDAGLVLAMMSTVPYPPGASADGTIKKINGQTLDSLAFDHKIGTHCTGGSPRWSVETVAGSYAFGCAAGLHVDNGNGWETITFSDADVQVLGGPAWPGFGNAEITFLQVLQDEEGSTTLDNLTVGIDGGTYVFTKPGAVSGN